MESIFDNLFVQVFLVLSRITFGTLILAVVFEPKSIIKEYDADEEW
jgi:hypothetical protein